MRPRLWDLHSDEGDLGAYRRGLRSVDTPSTLTAMTFWDPSFPGWESIENYSTEQCAAYFTKVLAAVVPVIEQVLGEVVDHDSFLQATTEQD